MKFLKTRNVLITLFLVILVFSAMVFIGDYKQVIKELSNVKISVIFVMLMLVLGNHFLKFLKWKFFLKRTSIKTSFVNSFLIFISGFSMGLTPGKVGEVIKAYLLYKKDKVNPRKSLPVIVTERLTDLLGLIFLSLLGASVFVPLKFMIILLLVLIVFIFLVTNEKFFFVIANLLSRIKLIEKYLTDIQLLHSNFKNLFSPRVMVISVLLSTISWGLEGVALYLLITSLGINTNILIIISIFAFSSIAGALSFIPGGLGVTEGSLVYLLLFSGIPLSVSTLSAIIIRLTTLWFSICIGLLGLFVVSRNISK